MSYPKPLSEKTLERLYKKSGLTEEGRAFLHSFFAACANLYGAIALRDMWKIYKELKGVPKLRRKDILTFASIARREEQPYYVFEVNELFDDEYTNELERHVVSKELVYAGYGTLYLFYSLLDKLNDTPHCIPDNFLSYADPAPSMYETALMEYLSNLKSERDECVSKYGRSVPNEHKGMTLNEFSFLNYDERVMLGWAKRPWEKAAILKDYAGTEVEKIMRFYKRSENIGSKSKEETLLWFLDELVEVGVVITAEKVLNLLKMTNEYHNNSRLWCLSGWKPCELDEKGSADTSLEDA